MPGKGFCETSQNLSSFRKFLFSLFLRGDPLKTIPKLKLWDIFRFFNLWNIENKSYLNELKFWEVFHEILNQANSKIFSCLSHVEPKNLSGCPQTRGKMIWSFDFSLIFLGIYWAPKTPRLLTIPDAKSLLKTDYR